MSKREENYELLRILCVIAVIYIHVIAKYVLFYNSPNNFINLKVYKLYFINVFGIFAIFSVPCYVMLLGVFLLDDWYWDFDSFLSKVKMVNGKILLNLILFG